MSTVSEDSARQREMSLREIHLYEELIQTAAVAVSAAQCLRHGKAGLDAGLELTLDDVRLEREAQNRKWGAQSHDMATWMTILGEEFGESCEAALKLRFGENG